MLSPPKRSQRAIDQVNVARVWWLAVVNHGPASGSRRARASECKLPRLSRAREGRGERWIAAKQRKEATTANCVISDARAIHRDPICKLLPTRWIVSRRFFQRSLIGKPEAPSSLRTFDFRVGESRARPFSFICPRLVIRSDILRAKCRAGTTRPHPARLLHFS